MPFCRLLSLDLHVKMIKNMAGPDQSWTSGIGWMVHGLVQTLGNPLYWILEWRVWTHQEASFSGFLTITSPLASKRECKANSKLVPPPGNALEQHKFRRFSTVGNKEKPLHQKELGIMENNTRPGARGPRERSKSCPSTFSRVPIPCCWRSWFSSSGKGFHTSVALCVSWARAEASWSSGISAWNRKPMLMRL